MVGVFYSSAVDLRVQPKAMKLIFVDSPQNMQHLYFLMCKAVFLENLDLIIKEVAIE
jgi:hypothetical protein